MFIENKVKKESAVKELLGILFLFQMKKFKFNFVKNYINLRYHRKKIIHFKLCTYKLLFVYKDFVENDLCLKNEVTNMQCRVQKMTATPR